MNDTQILELFDNLIESDIHITIEYILMREKSYTAEQLLEWYDNL
jgi:hypothetical protein